VAAESFDEVERQHPYSVWATKAQLMAGYAHYEANKYDEAIIALERFIQLHPGNRDIAYAHYLKALSYYEQISDVSRDQLATERARQSLQELIRRFPNSKYARDARLKLDLTLDHLAGKEMEIGRYYLRKDQYLAAINRFRHVVDRYQTTTHVPEALHRLAEAYSALGVTVEAQRNAAVLGHNYPGSEWYIDSYKLVAGVDVRRGKEEEKKGFIARAWDWIF
jgi:outer membrane protein assembly factor BamD